MWLGKEYLDSEHERPAVRSRIVGHLVKAVIKYDGEDGAVFGCTIEATILDEVRLLLLVLLSTKHIQHIHPWG